MFCLNGSSCTVWGSYPRCSSMPTWHGERCGKYNKDKTEPVVQMAPRFFIIVLRFLHRINEAIQDLFYFQTKEGQQSPLRSDRIFDHIYEQLYSFDNEWRHYLHCFPFLAPILPTKRKIILMYVKPSTSTKPDLQSCPA